MPLRSWIRKLNPEAAPKPDSVGMLNGKMIASGNRGELLLQPGHDALDVQRLAFAALPTASDERRASVVRLVGVGDHAIAADRLDTTRPLGLREDLLDLLQHLAGALERSARRKLHVDTENALVLIRDKSGGDRLREEDRADRPPTPTMPIVRIAFANKQSRDAARSPWSSRRILY